MTGLLSGIKHTISFTAYLKFRGERKSLLYRLIVTTNKLLPFTFISPTHALANHTIISVDSLII